MLQKVWYIFLYRSLNQFKISKFISIGEEELLSYSDEDEHLNDCKGSPAKKSKKKQTLRIVETSDSSEDDTKQEKVSKPIVPKIVLSKKLDCADPEVSFAPVNFTIFNASTLSTTKMDISHYDKTNKSLYAGPMDIDSNDVEQEISSKSKISPKKNLLERSRKDSEDVVGTEAVKKTPKRKSKVSFNEEDKTTPEDMEITEIKSSTKKSPKRASTSSKKNSDSPKVQSEFSNLRVIDLPKLSPANMTQHPDESGDDEWIDYSHSSTDDEEVPSDESNVFSSDEEQNLLTRDKKVNAGNSIGIPNGSSSSSKNKVATKTPEELDAILQKCNLILKERKEEKKKNQNLHKKKKVSIKYFYLIENQKLIHYGLILI